VSGGIVSGAEDPEDTVGYALGIDLGTTYTAAATFRDGRVEIANLGNRAAAIPSVVLLREDETVLTGEAADRRGLSEPERVAREFKRRLGDTTPIFVGGVPYSAEALMARLLRSVSDEVVSREGGKPDAIAISHPANWGPYKTDLLSQAVRLAELPGATLLTEPQAAALHYASTERVEAGQVIAVYDLGGGTFDAAVLRKTGDGFEVLGEPEGIERLGGIDFDAAVFAHVARALDGALDQLDEDDPAALAAVARLRQECVEAKEALSTDTDVSIPVLLPNMQTEVRLTRTEFEAMVRPALSDSIDALRRAMRSASIEPADLEAVVLIGGSSRIPLVSQLVSGEVGRPVAIDTHPKHAVALGAARRAAMDAGMDGAGLLAAEPGAEGGSGPSAGGAAVAGGVAGAALSAAAAAAAAPAPDLPKAPVTPYTPPPEAPAPTPPAAPPVAPAPAADAPVPPAQSPAFATTTPSLPYASQTPPSPPKLLPPTPTDPTPRPDPATAQQQIVVPPQPPQQPPQQPAAHGGGEPPKKRKKKRRTPVGVILVGILVILGLAAGIAWFVSEGLKEDDEPTTEDVAIDEGGTEDTTDPGSDDPVPCTDQEFTVLACLTEVSVDENDQIIADFDTFGFVPSLDTEGGDSLPENSNHLHFFLNPPVDQSTAGTPSPDENWVIWDDRHPFDGIRAQTARDLGATALCVVVATHEHEVLPGTGNCAQIPL
jgi:actin-like ATPase involved in cell morphogenesis